MIAARTYAGRDDLAALLDFAGRCCAERAPLPSAWHPGDIVWEMKGAYGQRQPIRFWQGPSGVEAIAWFTGPGEVWIEALPQSEHRVADAAAWAEEKLRNRTPGKQLAIRSFEGDARRIAALEALGYVKGASDGVWFRLDLALERETLPLAEGFRIRDSTDVDPEARAKAHRDAWDDLSRIGLPDVRSSFSAELYRSLRDAPRYDPELDILVEAPDGRLVANCIAWADTPSGIGIFEPVGTHAQFRGRRLARLAIEEGLRRLAGRGMRWARIGTAHFNHPAFAAYTAAGFEFYDRSSWWTKML